MEKNIYVRVNGRGNAWPVFLGSDHPFYKKSSDDLANASYSLYRSNGQPGLENTDWEIVIDAGHHTVPYLIKNTNRIPEALVITHPHMDHTLGIDWIVQSYYHLNNKKLYPVYATSPCRDFIIQSYPHLKGILEFKELKAGVTTQISEADGVKVTPFPVFHGENGFGASMLFFEITKSPDKASSLVFTGDMLCPLLRKKDFKTLASAQAIYIDCNNRFPYPGSNHGSFSDIDPNTQKVSERLTDWKTKARISHLLAPHMVRKYDNDLHSYFDEFISDFKNSDWPLSIVDFINRVAIPHVHLIHYSGLEDRKYYGERIFTDEELEIWANRIFSEKKINSKVIVPRVGNLFNLE
ncbi:MAG: hypothetical protein JXJ22_13820 [Bacteroidales bacterium]|nr:hypothetical protein [Bacteroidales bacterium]